MSLLQRLSNISKLPWLCACSERQQAGSSSAAPVTQISNTQTKTYIEPGSARLENALLEDAFPGGDGSAWPGLL